MEERIINQLKVIGIKAIAFFLPLFIILLGAGFVKLIESTSYPDFYLNYNTGLFANVEGVEDLSLSSYYVRYNSNDEPYVILDNADAEHNGYSQEKKDGYSPIILYTNTHALEPDSGFMVNDNKKSSKNITIQKNFSIILDGLEQDKSWQDIGIKENVLSGKITLAVPDKYSNYRQAVKEFFMITLSDNIDENNYEEISEKAEILLSKCIQMETVQGYMLGAVSKQENNIMVVAPECIMNSENKNIFACDCEEKEGFVAVYPTKTTAIYYSMFIKDGLEEDLEDTAKNDLRSTISTHTGFRNSRYGISKIHGSNILENVNIVSLQ